MPNDKQEESRLEVEAIEEKLNEEFEFYMRKAWDKIEEMKRNLGRKLETEQDNLLCQIFMSKPNFLLLR